jgi:hypothetical protein
MLQSGALSPGQCSGRSCAVTVTACEVKLDPSGVGGALLPETD